MRGRIASDRPGEGARIGHRRPAFPVLLLALALMLTTARVALAEQHRVRAAPERWRPTHLYIAEGDTVVWVNPDDRRHNVLGYGGGWRFRRTLDPGERARRVFDDARSRPFRYRCTFHSAIVDGRCEGMCGLIHVFTA